ncbi:MAG: hypothetical protein KDH96_01475 [Candidatus Riesia sp.]|nr:hypothetical protein [Candidatus Riesia sp.]
MSKIKVSDLIDFKVEDYNLAKSTMEELDVLCDTYSAMVEVLDPNKLDELKRRFVSHMSTLTNVYSKIKAYKGANHTYLEDTRKEFKAQAFKIVRQGYTEKVEGKDIKIGGVGATEANVTVYDVPYYKERISLMEDLKAFFIKVDEKFKFYTTVLQLIQQTISIVSKDYEYSRYSK